MAPRPKVGTFHERSAKALMFKGLQKSFSLPSPSGDAVLGHFPYARTALCFSLFHLHKQRCHYHVLGMREPRFKGARCPRSTTCKESEVRELSSRIQNVLAARQSGA